MKWRVGTRRDISPLKSKDHWASKTRSASRGSPGFVLPAAFLLKERPVEMSPEKSTRNQFWRGPTWIFKNICLRLAVFFPLQACPATLSLTGVAEGAQLVLPSSVSTTNLNVTASISGSSETAAVEFSLETRGFVIQRLISPPPYEVTFTNLVSGKYFLSAVLQDGSNVTADVSFDVSPFPNKPPNDHWANAILISDPGIVTLGTNRFATQEGSEPVHAANTGGRSIWFRWQPIASGVVTATTAGSDFDTILAVYTGRSLTNLARVGVSDDAGWDGDYFSQITFNATSGTNYYFAIDGASSANDEISIGISHFRVIAAPPPAIAILSPADGLERTVATKQSVTNVNLAASIQDGAGILSVEYRLDGGGNESRIGTLAAPFQLSLTNLVAGDYWLSIRAVNAQQLVTVAHAGFSIVALAPGIQLGDGLAGAKSDFQFVVIGFPGQGYVAEVSTNLTEWNSLRIWTDFSGVEMVKDTNAINVSSRFYRAVSR